jgi:hypothetical protein
MQVLVYAAVELVVIVQMRRSLRQTLFKNDRLIGKVREQ